MFKESDTQIGTLNVRGEGSRADRPALFRRLSYLFDTVDFRPHGIPPPGILIVRHMTDPLPGKLMNTDTSIRAGIAWEQAAQNVLTEKYRKAARPVHGRIPTDAEAVFFADEAQMLAALALDMSKGEALSRWWWKLVLKKLKPSHDVNSLLCREITLLPAVLQCLAQWGAAQKVTGVLSKDQALHVLETLGREYRLDETLAPVFHPKEIPAPKAAESHVKPPWEQWLPPHWVPSQLNGEKAVLLGIGLSLRYRPAKLRTPSFIREFQNWWEHRQTLKKPSRPYQISSTEPGRGEPPREKMGTGKNTALEEGGREPAPPVPIRDKKTGTGENAPTIPSTHTTERDEPPVSKDMGRRQRDSSRSKEKEKIGRKIRFDIDLDKPLTTVPPGPAKPEPVKETAPYFSEEGVDTQLGGVFYLVNLMKHLDLPGCFEEQCSLASRVGAWGVLELLARALLGKKYRYLENDPLWRELALLDNRPADTPGLPGDDFYCRRDIHPPETWQAAPKQLDSTFLNGLNPHLKQWLTLVMPYIRSRLQQALKLHDGKGPDAAEALLLYPARVYVTSTHVDIVLSMEHISIPVRMAGLDRDPGWMPEFARVILFHFN